MDLQHRYSTAINNKKILILGPSFTIPGQFIGGIAVHIDRVAAKFKTQKNQVKIVDFTLSTRLNYIFKYIKLFKELIVWRPNLVYHHTLFLRRSLFELLLLVLLQLILRYQVVTVDHDCRYLYKRSRFFKYVLAKLLRWVHLCVVIGNTTAQSYRDNNITVPFSIESPFLPPQDSATISYDTLYPKELVTFISQKSPLLGANASQLLLVNDEDIYGLDIALVAVGELKKQFPAIGLVIAIARVSNHQYFNRLQSLTESLGLKDAVYFLTGNRQFWPLLKKLDLFLRPTRNESFGISVAEALYFSVPVVASDACVRPKDVILFKSGDIQACVKASMKIVEQKKIR